MENNIERNIEKIPTKEEVMDIISRYAENPTLVRELSDEKGLYFIETKTEGKDLGESTEFRYTRKGVFPNHIESSVSVVHRIDYKDEEPFWGVNIEEFDEKTNSWKKVE